MFQLLFPSSEQFPLEFPVKRGTWGIALNVPMLMVWCVQLGVRDEDMIAGEVLSLLVFCILKCLANDLNLNIQATICIWKGAWIDFYVIPSRYFCHLLVSDKYFIMGWTIGVYADNVRPTDFFTFHRILDEKPLFMDKMLLSIAPVDMLDAKNTTWTPV